MGNKKDSAFLSYDRESLSTPFFNTKHVLIKGLRDILFNILLIILMNYIKGTLF